MSRESIVSALSMIIIAMVVPRLIWAMRTEDSLPNVVKSPKACYIIGIGDLSFAGFATIATIKDKEPWFLISFFGLFALLGLYLALYGLLWKITYNDSCFTYRTFYGKTTKAFYSNITRIKRGKTVDHFYAGKKHFRVDHIAVGYDTFMKTMALGMAFEWFRRN